MKIFSLLFLVIFGFFGAAAQERYVTPVDEAKKDASFLAFRTKLIAATKKRDAKYVLSIVDANIKNSFGGDGGIAEFKNYWKIENPNSQFWKEFAPVINNGGKFIDAADSPAFFAPYSFTDFPADLDSFTYSVIFGNAVNLRSQADAKAKVVGSLSYNVVEIINTIKENEKSEKVLWYEIKSLGGKQGFVRADYVRSPVAYRAGFEKRDGKWKMNFFAAGD